MKTLFLWSLSLLTVSVQASVNPMHAPVWSEQEKFQSKYTVGIPQLNRNFVASAGFNYGFKTGSGLDATLCKTVSRYLCLGGRIFLGAVQSEVLVRSPSGAESSASNVPSTSEYETIRNAAQNWFAFVPEIGATVHTQIIPLADQLWSESAWFGFGKAFMGDRSGWAISFEPAIRKQLAKSDFGWTVKAKYTFGWLNPETDTHGTIPFDWFNLTAGIFYVW